VRFLQLDRSIEPFHAIFISACRISPAVGHLGFHRMVVGGDTSVASDNYFHYLHHRFFTVNFGVEAFPLDWWFKTRMTVAGKPGAHAGRTTA